MVITAAVPCKKVDLLGHKDPRNSDILVVLSGVEVHRARPNLAECLPASRHLETM